MSRQARRCRLRATRQLSHEVLENRRLLAVVHIAQQRLLIEGNARDDDYTVYIDTKSTDSLFDDALCVDSVEYGQTVHQEFGMWDSDLRSVKSIAMNGIGGHDRLVNLTGLPPILHAGSSQVDASIELGFRLLSSAGFGERQVTRAISDNAEVHLSGPNNMFVSGKIGNEYGSLELITHRILKSPSGATPISQVVFSGGPGDDTFTNDTNISSTAYGGAGNDVLIGGSAVDWLYGDWSNENDPLFRGAGNDSLYGRDGDDFLFGGRGNDLLHGASGNDTLNGGSGNDRLWGGTGDDNLLGATGDDALYGGEGNDILSGLDGADQLYGELGDDLLLGGNGNDLLVGGEGFDRLYGGLGQDRLDGEFGFGGDGLDILLNPNLVQGGPNFPLPFNKLA